MALYIHTNAKCAFPESGAYTRVTHLGLVPSFAMAQQWLQAPSPSVPTTASQAQPLFFVSTIDPFSGKLEVQSTAIILFSQALILLT